MDWCWRTSRCKRRHFADYYVAYWEAPFVHQSWSLKDWSVVLWTAWNWENPFGESHCDRMSNELHSRKRPWAAQHVRGREREKRAPSVRTGQREPALHRILWRIGLTGSSKRKECWFKLSNGPYRRSTPYWNRRSGQETRDVCDWCNQQAWPARLSSSQDR